MRAGQVSARASVTLPKASSPPLNYVIANFPNYTRRQMVPMLFNRYSTLFLFWYQNFWCLPTYCRVHVDWDLWIGPMRQGDKWMMKFAFFDLLSHVFFITHHWNQGLFISNITNVTNTKKCPKYLHHTKKIAYMTLLILIKHLLVIAF